MVLSINRGGDASVLHVGVLGKTTFIWIHAACRNSFDKRYLRTKNRADPASMGELIVAFSPHFD